MSYPYTLERSVGPWGPRLEDDEAEFERRCRERASSALWEAVERNVDRTLPGGGSSQWAVSTYLGECSREAQALLFAACHAACDPNHNLRRENAHIAAAKLRAFVERVANEYGDDHYREWQ